MSSPDTTDEIHDARDGSDLPPTAHDARPAPDPARLRELDDALVRFESQKRWQDVIKTLQSKAEILIENPDRVATWERVASIYIERFSNQAEAIKAYEAVLDIDAENLRALEFLKGMYEKRRDWDKLLALLRREAQRPPEETQLDRYLAIARFATDKVKRPEVCIEMWEQVQRRDAQHPEALTQLAGLYERARDYGKLATVLREQAAQTPDATGRINLLVKLGMIASDKLSDDVLAVEAWRGVLALDPNDRRAQEALKKRFIAMHAWDDLEAFYAESARWDELIRVLEREVENPQCPAEVKIQLFAKIAQLWAERKEKSDRAAKYLEKILEIDPQHRAAAVRLAPIYTAANDPKKLASVLEVKLLGDDSAEERVATLRELGALYENPLKDPERAFDRYRHAFLASAADPRSLDDLERAAAATDRYAAAVDDVALVLAKGSLAVDQQIPLRLRLGHILAERLERVDDAIERYREVLRADPANGDALKALEALLRGSGRNHDLLDVLERRLALADDPAARRELRYAIAALSEDALDDPGRAIESCLAILSEFGDEPDALRALDRLFQKLGRWQDLAGVLERELVALQDSGAPEEETTDVKFRLGRVLEQHLGEATSAVGHYRDILSGAPEHEGARAALEARLRDPDLRGECARILEPVYELRGDWESLIRAAEILLTDEATQDARTALYRKIGDACARHLGDPRRAFDAYGRAFREDPAREDVRQTLVDLAGPVGAWSALVTLFRDAAESTGSADLSRALWLQIAAVDFHQLGDVDQAVAAYEHVLASDPADGEALAALEGTLRAAERWNDLLAVYRRRLELTEDPDSHDAILADIAGVHEEMLGDADAAIRSYREMLARDPANPRALEALDRLLTRLERWPDLAENLQTRLALAETPAEQSALMLRLARLREERMGETEAAIEIHRQILARDPNDVEALSALERLVESPPFASAVAEILEPVYRSVGSFDRLAAVYEILAHNAGDPAVRVELLHRIADIQESALDDPTAAFHAIARALREDPSHEETLHALDRISRALGNHEELVATLEARVETAPPAVRIGLHQRAAAVAEERLESFERAITHQRAILDLDGRNLEAASALERLFQASDRAADQASIYLIKADLLDDAEERKAYLLRASEIFETVLDDPEAAIDAQRRILAVDAEDLGAMDALIRLFISHARWEDLLAVYERKAALLSDPAEKKRLYFEVATVYETELRDNGRAIDAYHRVLELDPEELVAIQRLDHLYVAQGNWRELLSILEREADLSNDPNEVCSHRFRIAEIHEKHLDDTPRAVDLYREILDSMPDHEPSLTALGNILRGTREPLAAAAVLEPVLSSVGAYDKLVAVLEVQLAHSTDAPRAIELLHRIAELHETMLDNARAAFDALARAVAVDPSVEQSLGDFERIGDGLGAWADVASTYDATIAALEADPLRRVELVLRTAQIYEVQVGDADAAVERYRIALAADPENAVAMRSLDRLFEASERWAELADVLRREVELPDQAPEDALELKSRLAQVLEQRLGDVDGAIATWREIVDVQTDHPATVAALENLFARGVRQKDVADILDPIYRVGGEWEKLAAIQEKCLEFVTEPAERLAAIYRAAELYEDRLSDAVGAFTWYGRALREHPLDERTQTEAERLAAVTGAWADLTNVYVDVIEAEGTTDAVRQVLGKKLARVHEEELQDLDAAEQAYNYVLEVAPLDTDVLAALDRLYTSAGDAAKLAGVLDRRVQAAGDDEARTELTYRLAQILHEELAQTDAAVARYRSIVEGTDPRHGPSLDALEAIYVQTERWQDLYGIYEKKLEVAVDGAQQAEIFAHLARLADQYLGRPDDAVRLLEQVLALRGEDSEALSALAGLHEAAGRYQDLIDVLERQLASEEDPERRAGIALRIPAVYLHRLEDVDRAVEGYRRVLDIDPASFDALRALAEIYRGAQQWYELVATLQTVISLGAATLPDTELKTAYAELGRIFWEVLHQGYDAIDAWTQALQIDPRDEAAIEALLAIRTAQEEWREVVEVLQRKADAQSIDEARVPVYLQIAQVWEQRIEEPDGARGAYEKILEVDALHEHAFAALEALHREHERWEDLATLYVSRHDKLAEDGDVKGAVPFMRNAARIFDEKLGDTEQAFAAAQIAFDEDVADRETLEVLERLAGVTARWNELLKTTLETYQAEAPSPRKTQLGLHVAKWYGVELGHPEWAIPIYNQILTAEPDNLLALQSMGTLYRKLGQWDQLARILQRCVDVARNDEDRSRVHVELGEVLEKNLQRVDEAIGHYQAALAVNARDADALAALGRVYGNRGEWGLLVDVLRAGIAIASDPQELVENRLRVGEILEDRLGDLETAILEYREVLRVEEGNLAALRGLERLYARLNLPQELLRILEAELEVVGTERERIKLLTRIAEMLEEEFVKPELAIQRFEQILEIDPSNDNALRGLERLYRNTARWNEMIQTLERHLVATPERRDRVPIFDQMGRVYADELHDLDHAEDAWLNVLQIDAQNVGALESLARVYESKADWHRAVEIMEQLAGLLASDPSRTVDLRQRIARIAEENLQDEERAVELYRSALDVDPNYAPALAALRTIAARQGDWHDVSRYLDREQSVTEQPRARARLLAELGRIAATQLDEPERAVACYEAAIGCDADLEEAALPLCHHYVEQGRWADAEPLAEMLVRKVARRDPAEQLQIQLTTGRIAMQLGKLDRAVKAFAAAQSLDRSNVEAIRSLAFACFEKADWESAFKNYQLLLVHHKEELDPESRADLYYRLGVVKREQGDRRRAINFLDKALEEVPGYRPALEALILTYSAANEWEQVIAFKSQLLDQEDNDDRRFAALVDIAQLWQEKARNPQKAIQSYAAAVELHPQDHVLLHKLLVLYQETRQWSKVIDVVGRIAELEPDPVKKSRYAYTIATIYNSEIKNADEALNFYNQALDLNPTELKPFAKINEILTARKDFKQLERNFRKMLHRTAGKGDKDLEFNLLHNLGVIYRDRLGQTDAAIKAFVMASDRQPDNLTEHRILAELQSRAGNTVEAVARWYTILSSDLANADALHALYDLYYKSRQYDRAWCVASTASFLLRERAREDIRAFHEQYRPRGAIKATGRLTEEQWVKSLFHPNEDPVVGKIFASILGALRKAKVQPVARFGFTQKDQHDPATSSVALVKALGSAATALNLPTPWIFLRPTQPGGLGYVPSEPIASFAGSGLLSGLNPGELAFVAAKHMAYYRNEHYIRVLFPTVQEITAILLAAIKLVKTDQDVPPEALQTAQQLAPMVAQDPLATENLRTVVKVFLDLGGASNIKKWYQAVELTASHAGFLLAGDLEVAKKMLALEPGLPGDVPPGEKLKDVVLFSLSEKYFQLREALGINFQAG